MRSLVFSSLARAFSVHGGGLRWTATAPERTCTAHTGHAGQRNRRHLVVLDSGGLKTGLQGFYGGLACGGLADCRGLDSGDWIVSPGDFWPDPGGFGCSGGFRLGRTLDRSVMRTLKIKKTVQCTRLVKHGAKLHLHLLSIYFFLTIQFARNITTCAKGRNITTDKLFCGDNTPTPAGADLHLRARFQQTCVAGGRDTRGDDTHAAITHTRRQHENITRTKHARADCTCSGVRCHVCPNRAKPCFSPRQLYAQAHARALT